MFVFHKLASNTKNLVFYPMIDDLFRLRRSDDWLDRSINGSHNETIGEIEEDLNICPWLNFFLDFCHVYYIPSIILLGLVGNLLSCVVFLKTPLRLRSSSYYLATLATADFTYLMCLLLVWFNSTIGWKVYDNNGWCETVVYISAVCSSLSVWLIVAFTVERFIAVYYPLQRPHMCTIKRAKKTISILTIIALLSHLYSFVIAGLVKNRNGYEVCDLREDYLQTMHIISIIDSIVSLIVPLVLIVGMNTMIMKKLVKFSRQFNQQSGYIANCPERNSNINLGQIPSANNSNNAGGENIRLHSLERIRVERMQRPPSQQSQQSVHSSRNYSRDRPSSGEPSTPRNRTRRPPSQQSSGHSSRNNSRDRPSSARPSTPQNTCRLCTITKPEPRLRPVRYNQESITKMLVLISTVFILLNLPSYMIRLCAYFFDLTKENAPTIFWCLQQLFMLLYYTNFSINFLLYAMCGITFRRCLWHFITGCIQRYTPYTCSPVRELSPNLR